MTLVADENIPYPIIHALQDVRYDVVRAADAGARGPDAAVMEATLRRGHLLMTMDVGLPSQAYVDRFAARGLSVVLLRWKTSTARDWQQILETILRDGEKWHRHAAERPCVISVRYFRSRVRPWDTLPSFGQET